MRSDPIVFSSPNAAPSREMRVGIQIVFDLSSPTFTTHTMTNVPGTPIQEVLRSVTGISQSIQPEKGQATIGSFSFSMIDVGVTDELRDQLLNPAIDQGSREKEVRVWAGFTDDWNDMVQVGTAYIDGSIEYNNGVYKFSCADKTKRLKKTILEPKTTYLTADITDGSESPLQDFTVNSTTGFETFYHGTGHDWVGTCGYLLIKESGEIVRWTSKGATSFTIDERGCFRTKPQALEWDAQQPDALTVEEFIYLEMPAVAMAIALMTGELDVTASPAVTLPSHWHLNLDWDTDFDQAAWTGIGNDLWVSGDDAVGFPARLFFGERTECKTFVESEIYRLVGIYAPTTPMGDISLRRITGVGRTSSFVKSLGKLDIVKYGPLSHDQNAVQNNWRINYNWDGEEFTRAILMVDSQSIDRHSDAKQVEESYVLLHTARHTRLAIATILQTRSDRYSEPPLRLTLDLTPNHNNLEVGDRVRVMIDDHDWIRDFTYDFPGDYGGDERFVRTMEIQQVRVNWITGAVKVTLFGSSSEANARIINQSNTAPIADSWYTTGITALPNVSGGQLTVNTTITGTLDQNNASGSIWHVNGDLEIPLGVTLTINNNAQLRIKGFLTVNGVINGAGLGRDGATETDSAGGTSTGWTKAGASGVLGPTTAGDGAWRYQTFLSGEWMTHVAGVQTPVLEGQGSGQAAPMDLQTTAAGALTGLFDRLAGTSGGTGGQVIETIKGSLSPPYNSGGTISALGGDGGDAGSGLCIICRGLGFGASGYIDLSGTDGQAGQVQPGPPWTGHLYDLFDENGNQSLIDFPFRGGGGAGGFPGALYILLDGDGEVYPDINNDTVRLNRGLTPIAGFQAIPDAGSLTFGMWDIRWSSALGGGGRGIDQTPIPYLTGLQTDVLSTTENLWSTACRVQYVPAAADPVEDVVPAPSGLTATAGVGQVLLQWQSNGTVDYYEVWQTNPGAANDRSFANLVGEVAGTTTTITVAGGGQVYYWLRAVRNDERSAFHPLSDIAGVGANPSDAGIAVTITSSQSLTWIGDQSASPTSWSPASNVNTITCAVKQGGSTIATEQVQLTLSESTGEISHAITSPHDDISLVATPSGASPTKTLEFTHDPSDQANSVVAQAVLSGEPGPPGADGAKTLGVKKGYVTWSTANAGYVYVHGYTDGTAADVDGTFVFGNTEYTVTKGGVWAWSSTENYTTPGGAEVQVSGYFVYDTAVSTPPPFSHPGSQDHIGACRNTASGWQYDATGTWTGFTATADMVVIGVYHTNSSNQVVSATMLASPIPLENIPRESAYITDTVEPDAIADKLAFISTLRPPEIVTVLPTISGTPPNYADGNMVFLTSDQRLYKATNGEWVRAVPPTYNGLIADPNWSEGHIGSRPNAVGDPTQTDESEYEWFDYASTTIDAKAEVFKSASPFKGENIVRNKTGGAQAQITSRDFIPFDPARSYRASVTYRAQATLAGPSDFYAYVAFYDKDKNRLDVSSPDEQGWVSTGTFHYFAFDANASTSWNTVTRLFGATYQEGPPLRAEVPPNTAFMRVGAILNQDAHATDVHQLGELMISEAIDDSVLVKDAITVGVLAAGAVTADALATNLILTTNLYTADYGASPTPYYLRLQDSSLPIYYGNQATPDFEGGKFAVNDQGDVKLAGELDASWIKAKDDDALSARTSNDNVAALSAIIETWSVGTATSTTPTVFATGQSLYEPTYSTGNTWHRLQVRQQPIMLRYDGEIHIWAGAGTSANIQTYSLQAEYRYDGAGGWTSWASKTFTMYHNGINWRNTYQPFHEMKWVEAKSTSFNYLEFRFTIAYSGGVTSLDAVCGVQFSAFVPNFGDAGQTVVTLT